MKDRIKNEVTAFLKSFPFGKVPDANQLAEHFYNLALDDVKKEVESILEKSRCKIETEARDYILDIKDFIENQEV